MVYRATQERFERTVAVKVLAAEDLDQLTRDRFERECRAMGALSDHPSIATVYEGGFTAAGHPYLVMEYYPRGSLADHLTTAGPLSAGEVLAIGAGLADALAAAHRAGIIHRDIKPANVLVGAYGQHALADFGIARIAGAAETASTVITATLAHAAPEVLDRARPSEASDIYSLGSTLYELLTGAPAFVRPDEETIAALVSRIATEPVPDLRTRGVPDAVASAIERAMAKDPAERFADATVMADALRRAAEGGGAATVLRADLPSPPGRAGADRPGRPRRRRVLVAAIIAAIVVAAAGMAWASQNTGSNEQAEETTTTSATPATTAAAAEATTTTGIVAERPSAGEAIFNDAIAARTPFFGDLGIYTGDLDSEEAEAALLGAWWGLADWCTREGFAAEGTCYDHAAEYLNGGVDRDPRTVNDDAWMHPGAIGGLIDTTYALAWQYLDADQGTAAAYNPDVQRPGVDVLCEPSCAQVLGS